MAENKTFIREYTYQASESDSKLTARAQALTEVKKLLLEELGVYVESYVNYTVESQEGKISKDFLTNEIKQLSAGITETKILEESWNGEQYYIKAEIAADPSDVVRRINQTLEKRQSDVVIDSLHILLSNMKKNVEFKNEEISKLNEQLKIQTVTNKTQEQKVASLNGQLATMRIQLAKYEQEEREIISEIDRIKQNLQKFTNKAVENARAGMSPAEVKSVCGNPRSSDETFQYAGYIWYNYGYVWLGFYKQSLLVMVPLEKFDGGNPSSYTYEKYIIKR